MTNWPIKQTTSSSAEAIDKEVRAKFIGAIVQRGVVDYRRFSRYVQLIRAIKVGGHRDAGEFGAAELDRSIATTCRLVQEDEMVLS